VTPGDDGVPAALDHCSFPYLQSATAVLQRTVRCITYDGRGNAKSDRPADVAAYSLEHNVKDAIA